jgi:lipopolysaccharide/colanic/teichoic acid biosynthesis glycosyltransferase
VFDKLVAMTGLILLFPLFIAIMIAIKLIDRGPVFFRQVRVGKNGNTFRVWNSAPWWWTPNSQAELSELNEAAGALFRDAPGPTGDQDGRVAAALVAG